jgi:hypothetical protein
VEAGRVEDRRGAALALDQPLGAQFLEHSGDDLPNGTNGVGYLLLGRRDRPAFSLLIPDGEVE